MNPDKIGYFKGKGISNMTRDELLDFAQWASNRIPHLEMIAEKHAELDLETEVLMSHLDETR